MRISTLLNKSILFVAITIAAIQTQAQDLHFSQYYTHASMLNPSLVGNYDGSYRIAAIYRDQWSAAVGKSGFKTVGADVDFCLLEGYLKTDKLAIGVGFFNDRSGSAGKPLGTYAYAQMISELDLSLLTFDYLQESGACIVGGPERCLEVARRYDAADCDLLLCLLNPYKISHESVMKSISLLGEHVIPELQA